MTLIERQFWSCRQFFSWLTQGCSIDEGFYEFMEPKNGVKIWLLVLDLINWISAKNLELYPTMFSHLHQSNPQNLIFATFGHAEKTTTTSKNLTENLTLTEKRTLITSVESNTQV